MALQGLIDRVANTPGGAASDRSVESFRFLDLPAGMHQYTLWAPYLGLTNYGDQNSEISYTMTASTTYPGGYLAAEYLTGETMAASQIQSLGSA